jgi:hypothetical protein
MAGLLYGAQCAFDQRNLKHGILPTLIFPTCLDTRVGELECSLLSARKEAEEAREQILSLEAASRASTSGLTQQMEDLRYSHSESEGSGFNCAPSPPPPHYFFFFFFFM